MSVEETDIATIKCISSKDFHSPVSAEPSVSDHGADDGKKVGKHGERVVDDGGPIVRIPQHVTQVE